MNDISCDILVVGAGPGGSMAAKWAAAEGKDVLVIEKRQEIGSPVRCGEGISKYWLGDVGIRPDKRWIANEVKGARIFSPSMKVMELNEKMAGNEVGYVIERDHFDKALAIDAAKAGARYMVKTAALDLIKEGNKITGVKAKHMGENFRINAKMIIGADGFESQVGRWGGLNTVLKTNDEVSCLQYRMAGIECNPDYTDFYIGSFAPGGYVWVFPKGEGVANVGIGIELKFLKNKGDTKRMLDEFISRMPGLSKGKKIDMVAGAVSVSKPLDSVVRDNMMLVGDAGRMIDPLTGGGINAACISGKIAGKIASEAIESKDYSKEFLQKYEKGWRKELEEKMYRNWFAKERLSELSDTTLDNLLELLSNQKLDALTAHNILKVVKEKYPEVVKGFENFI
ncbi:MAG: NAD(P)/FAD-dependent oxidoreductase [Thermoplasmata archaeon]